MKTKFALAFYYLSIGFLTISAGVIIVKLIFWPPCTQIGNTCVIEPWSVAGLAGTVLAVAATVLAVLGAVAVAAWWTSLNERVNDQVKKHYEAQKKEFETRMNTLLMGQQALAEGQLKGLQVTVETLSKDISHVQELTERASELVQRTFEQSTQLLLKDTQAADVLARLQARLADAEQRAAELERLTYSYRELRDAWQQVSTELQRRLTEEAVHHSSDNAPDKPSNGASN